MAMEISLDSNFIYTSDNYVSPAWRKYAVTGISYSELCNTAEKARYAIIKFTGPAYNRFNGLTDSQLSPTNTFIDSFIKNSKKWIIDHRWIVYFVPFEDQASRSACGLGDNKLKTFLQKEDVSAVKFFVEAHIGNKETNSGYQDISLGDTYTKTGELLTNLNSISNALTDLGQDNNTQLFRQDFVDNGGSVYNFYINDKIFKSYVISDRSTIHTLPVAPVIPGKEFLGWKYLNSSKAGQTATTNDLIIPESTISLSGDPAVKLDAIYSDVDGIFDYEYDTTFQQATIKKFDFPSDGSKTYEVELPSIIENSTGMEFDVTTVGDRTFIGLKGLTKLHVPASITRIMLAFQECSKLNTVVFDNPRITIDKSSFKNCTKLTTIVYNGSAYDWNTNPSLVQVFGSITDEQSQLITSSSSLIVKTNSQLDYTVILFNPYIVSSRSTCSYKVRYSSPTDFIAIQNFSMASRFQNEYNKKPQSSTLGYRGYPILFVYDIESHLSTSVKKLDEVLNSQSFIGNVVYQRLMLVYFRVAKDENEFAYRYLAKQVGLTTKNLPLIVLGVPSNGYSTQYYLLNVNVDAAESSQELASTLETSINDILKNDPPKSDLTQPDYVIYYGIAPSSTITDAENASSISKSWWGYYIHDDYIVQGRKLTDSERFNKLTTTILSYIPNSPTTLLGYSNLNTFDDVLFSDNGKFSAKELNSIFAKLIQNDLYIMSNSDYIPNIWECRWYNDKSIQGYTKGHLCWKNNLMPMQNFLSSYSEIIHSYVLDNPVIYNNNKKIFQNEYNWFISSYYEHTNNVTENVLNKAKDEYSQVVQGYSIDSVKFPPLFDIGEWNVSTKPLKIYVSLIDNNKDQLSNTNSWASISLDSQEAFRYRLSSVVDQIMSTHLNNYHYGYPANTRDALTDLSNIVYPNLSGFTIDKVENKIKIPPGYNIETMQRGFDCVKTFVIDPVVQDDDTVLYRWFKLWNSGYLEFGGVVKRTNDLDYTQVDLNWSYYDAKTRKMLNTTTYTYPELPDSTTFYGDTRVTLQKADGSFDGRSYININGTDLSPDYRYQVTVTPINFDPSVDIGDYQDYSGSTVTKIKSILDLYKNFYPSVISISDYSITNEIEQITNTSFRIANSRHDLSFNYYSYHVTGFTFN